MSELMLQMQPGERCDCGGELVPGSKTHVLEHMGLCETVDIPGFYCTACGVSLCDARDMALIRAAHERLAARREAATG